LSTLHTGANDDLWKFKSLKHSSSW